MTNFHILLIIYGLIAFLFIYNIWDEPEILVALLFMETSACFVLFGVVFAATTGPTANFKPLSPNEYSIESGEYSASFQINGRIVRIEKAKEFSAFKNGNYQIISREYDDFWFDPSYGEHYEFLITEAK